MESTTDQAAASKVVHYMCDLQDAVIDETLVYQRAQQVPGPLQLWACGACPRENEAVVAARTLFQHPTLIALQALAWHVLCQDASQ